MRPARLLKLGLLIAAGCATALYILPARWVMAWIPESSPVMVTDATGTLWSARATLAVGAPGLRRTLPDPLQWRLSFAGGPHLELRHPWLRGPLELSPSWRGIHISSQSLQLPATALTTAHALLNALDPGGTVQVEWPAQTLGWGALPTDGDGRVLTLQWHNASSSLSSIKPFGDYTLLLSRSAGRSLDLSLKTDRGPLMLAGRGTLPRSGRARFDGEAWADPSAPPGTRAALRGVLHALGPNIDQQGKTRLRVR
ncbi:type II secretion system protein N [Candidimonas nitroreducens]|uniref:Type II secretion system protein N n=1 Tax=Candidimonas nitroreducens TaxID=683354 RepID=A0A225LWJ5_9BURK|nr:type II secretion system protein N [Candidimonas nitroreducens]OWT53466.1 general secretion pathway protein GspN [Candidimonas nitroreducens]